MKKTKWLLTASGILITAGIIVLVALIMQQKPQPVEMVMVNTPSRTPTATFTGPTKTAITYTLIPSEEEYWLTKTALVEESMIMTATFMAGPPTFTPTPSLSPTLPEQNLVLSFPEDHGVQDEYDMVFSWDSVWGAKEYTLEIQSLADGTRYLKRTFTENQAIIKDRFDDGEYKWHVIAWNWSGQRISWSQWRTYTRDYTPVTQIFPYHSASVRDSNPTFSWTELRQATAYQIRFYYPRDVILAEFTISPDCTDGICEFTPPEELDMGVNYGHYHWQVRAIVNETPQPWTKKSRYKYVKFP